MSRFLIIFGFIFLLIWFSSRTDAEFDSESLQQKLLALFRILTFMNNRPKQMNVDATYGVTLSEANLKAALLHKNAQYLESKLIMDVKDMAMFSNFVRRNLMDNVIPANEYEYYLQSTVNDPDLWIKSIWWTSIFPRGRLILTSEINYWTFFESMWHGAPNETQSDYCIVTIIRNSKENGECQIPETCREILLKDDCATGYSLTHRLLMIQIARAFGCREDIPVTFSYLIPAYCARIFQHFVSLEALNFPRITRDLVIEQILLCGMEGYYEFVNKRYKDLILSWQDQAGCFSLRYDEEHKISRRAASIIDFGCNNHMTGLAAGVLGLFIRQDIENAFV
ncbi:UPF0764 protein C16orf89 homolog isoform X2 [Pseudomyrmex gracilis]|uniref:UPF0764 protein C16orf89 homolog isoform X2 n=1 Tax=Pseudomyrmex gracilis TaxID=219809 RepID=UPI0009953477|nr:UPF0764 protein C16orf89 homolog isoform X2 [Pseudomyrmex gracilis]